MQVENIDCQIVQAQFGNYLSGSGLNAETIEVLESHIGQCSECCSVLEERRQRLKAMLASERPQIDFERIAQEAEVMQTRSIATALRKQSLQRMLEPAASVAPEAVESELDSIEVEQDNNIVAETETAVETDAAVLAPEAEPNVAIRRRRPATLAYVVALVTVLAGGIVFAANSDTILGRSTSEPVAPVQSLEANNAPAVKSTDDEPQPPKEIWVPLEDFGKPTTTNPKPSTAIPAKPEVQGLAKAAIVQTPAKPQVSKPVAKKWSRRKSVRRRPIRRSTARRTGVKVYNP